MSNFGLLMLELLLLKPLDILHQIVNFPDMYVAAKILLGIPGSSSMPAIVSRRRNRH